MATAIITGLQNNNNLNNLNNNNQIRTTHEPHNNQITNNTHICNKTPSINISCYDKNTNQSNPFKINNNNNNKNIKISKSIKSLNTDIYILCTKPNQIKDVCLLLNLKNNDLIIQIF